jgi:hypothetical protein
MDDRQMRDKFRFSQVACGSGLARVARISTGRLSFTSPNYTLSRYHIASDPGKEERKGT